MNSPPPSPVPWLSLVRRVAALAQESPNLSQAELATALALPPWAVSHALKVFPWIGDPKIASSRTLSTAANLVLAQERKEMDRVLSSLLGLEVSPTALPTWTGPKELPRVPTRLEREKQTTLAVAQKVTRYLLPILPYLEGSTEHDLVQIVKNALESQ